MHYKSLFVSDIHLGTKQSRVEYLLKFLHDNTFDNVFLVGDIIDIWALRHRWYWVFDDEVFSNSLTDNTFSFGDIQVHNEYTYKSVKGLKILLLHGDVFDGAIRSLGWLYWVGDRAYSIALSFNSIYNKCRKLFGLQYWSISAYLKTKIKKAIQVVNNFDELVARRCLVDGYDGVLYGHTHSPSMKRIKTKLIMNDGDMVESITCIVESLDGEFQLIRLTDNKIITKE
jgi:UDP-2,3-diacylglucosamine pyrophosphatase LpxH